jgi:hypothetical protein
MVMPIRRSDSELLREGFHSYHKALFAIMRFRREAQKAIRDAVDERIDDIAATLGLDKAEIGNGLTPYADPANFGQNWDGSEASVGLKYPARDFEAKWGIYFYFWIGNGEESRAGVSCWIKKHTWSGLLASMAGEGMEANDTEAWISEPINETDGLTGAIGRALDMWIELWHKVGGLQQFLPPRKDQAIQAGK